MSPAVWFSKKVTQCLENGDRMGSHPVSDGYCASICAVQPKDSTCDVVRQCC